MCETVPNFNAAIVKFMLDFLAQTVFQHYSLYSYVYQLPAREQDLVNVTLEVETARVPALSQGTLQVEPEGAMAEDGAGEEEEGAAAAAKQEGEAGEGGAEGEEGDEAAADDADASEDPNPVNDIIESEIARRVAEFKEKISKEYASREELLLQKMKEIETK